VILGWDVRLVTVLIGALVVIYTTTVARAPSAARSFQFLVIWLGWRRLRDGRGRDAFDVSFVEAIRLRETADG